MSVEIVLSRIDPLREPLISVVIPVYNGAEWITATLQSVLDQEGCSPCFEIIVVDDGSTDGGGSVAAELLRDSEVDARVLRTGNGGPSRARNIGLRYARGSWIQFLDADDLLHRSKLRLQSLACSDASLDTAVLYSDWTHLDRCGVGWQQRLSVCRPRVSENTVEALIRAENFVPFACALVRREWLERVGGFSCGDHRIIEDVDLLLRMALAGGGFTHVPTDFPLFFYRQHRASLSQRRDDLFAEGCYENAKLVEIHWRRAGALNAERRALLTQIYVFAARLAAPSSPARARQMLRGTARLALPAVGVSRVARRALVRALAHRSFGHRIARHCERVYSQLFRRSRRSRTESRESLGSSPESPHARAVGA